MQNRRDFIKTVAAGSVGMTIGGSLYGVSAKSYNRIIGANELVRIATIGVNSRGNSMGGTIAGQKNAEVGTVCDVDERAIPKAIETILKTKQSQLGRRLFLMASRKSATCRLSMPTLGLAVLRPCKLSSPPADFTSLMSFPSKSYTL